MNEQERESLRNVVVYSIDKEHDDYEEQDEEGKRNHIYLDLVRLNGYLGRSDDLDKSTSYALSGMTRTAVEYQRVLRALLTDGRLDQLSALMVRNVLDRFGSAVDADLLVVKSDGGDQ